MNRPSRFHRNIASDHASASPARPAGHRQRTRGQAMVEFALVFPVFILLVFGMIDFGFGLYSRMTVITAAREGARVAVVQPPEARVQPGYGALISGAVTSASHGLVVTTTATCVRTGGSCNFTAAANSTKGDYVVVVVHHTYQTHFPLLFGATFDIGSSVEMLLEN